MKDIPTIKIIREDGRGEQNPAFVIDGRRWSLVQDGLENFDGIGYEVSTQDYAQYDGACLMTERSGTVDRTISARSRIGREAARREAERFFIARRAYEVHVEYAGRARYCIGRQYGFRTAVEPCSDKQGLTWTFLALEPYWMSEDEKRFDLAKAEGKAGFSFCSYAAHEAQPSAFLHVRGFVAGVIRKEIWMDNGGGATAYPRFDVTVSADVKNPVITAENEAGEELLRVALTVDLHAGDAFAIDFSKRPTSVTLNGRNASHLVKPGSTLASGIEPGRFLVKWNADSGDASMRILPSIRERFASI